MTVALAPLATPACPPTPLQHSLSFEGDINLSTSIGKELLEWSPPRAFVACQASLAALNDPAVRSSPLAL
jgi:hypothetical protein